MNTLNKKENLVFISEILPSNNINNINSLLKNFLWIKNKNFDRAHFLNDFYGYLLSMFNIPKIELWLDKELAKENIDEGTIVYAYADADDSLKIFLNEKILTNTGRFFVDLCIMTHEFYHLVIDANNKKLNRQIGANPYRYLMGHYKENIQNIQFSYDLSYVVYYINEVETACEAFAHEFVISLMENLLPDFTKLSINKFLFEENLKKIKHLYEIRKTNYNTMIEKALPHIVLKTAIKQQFYLDKFKALVNKNIEKFRNQLPDMDFIRQIVNTMDNLVMSFSIHENLEILNELKDFCDEKSYDMPILSTFFVKCLNYPNYVVKKEDIKKLLTFVNINKQAFSFKEIKVDKESLKRTIIELTFGSYDNRFDDYILNNSLVKDNYMLCKTYNTFLKNQEKNDLMR